MVPQRVDIGFFKAGELEILSECGTLNALLQRHFQRRARAFPKGLHAIDCVCEQRSKLRPLTLVKHRDFNLAAPAVNLLWHEVVIVRAAAAPCRLTVELSGAHAGV